MRLRSPVIVLALILLVAGCGDDDGGTPGTPSVPQPVPAETLRCRTVAFTPNSEDAASDVTATGVTCAEAESLVRALGSRTTSGGPAQVQMEGYTCIRTRMETDPLPRSFYECTSGAQKVTFVRS